MYYSIVNTSRCGDVALDTGAAHNGWPLETWYPKDRKSSQLWEFIVPVVAIPAGWTQIRNLATGHVLSHTGLGDRPVAVIPPSPSSRYQYSEGWSLQWQFSARLSRADTNNCKDLETVEWIIENRLTGAILCREALHDLSSATMKESYDRELCSSGWTCLNGLWHPEVSLGGHWIIRSRKGGALEEIQTEAKTENDLAVDSNSTEDSRLRNWVFLSVSFEYTEPAF